MFEFKIHLNFFKEFVFTPNCSFVVSILASFSSFLGNESMSVGRLFVRKGFKYLNIKL